MTWNKDSIKELRLKLELSQQEFAHALGCRQQTISEWEIGLYKPANAYTKLLTQLSERQRYSQPYLKPAPKPAKESSMNFIEDEVIPIKAFDPAID